MLALDHVIFSLQRAGGISRWWEASASRLTRVLGDDMWHLGPYANSNSILEDCPELNRLSVATHFRQLDLFRRIELPNQVRVFHSSYFRTCRRDSRTAVVCTFHDAALLRGWSPRSLARRRLVSRAVSDADVVHCVSRTSALQLLRAFPKLDASKIRVVPHGVARVEPRRITGLQLETGNFVLWVGKRFGYKNGLICYPAVQLLQDTDIVFVGGEPPSDEERRLTAALGISSRVHYLGTIGSAELAWAYLNAAALWYTSLTEGFGLPLIEAAAYGCPVLASRAEAIREVAGDWAIMADTPNSEWLANETSRVSVPATRRLISSSGTALAKSYTWKSNVGHMLAIYEELGLAGAVQSIQCLTSA